MSSPRVPPTPIMPSAPGVEGAICFPSGLLGFPAHRMFQLKGFDRPGLWMLQGLDSAAPSFVLADPFVFFAGYEIELGCADLNTIGASTASEVCVLAPTVPDLLSGRWTANLQGPLAVNVNRALGAQVVLPNGRWGTQHAFFPMASDETQSDVVTHGVPRGPSVLSVATPQPLGT